MCNPEKSAPHLPSLNTGNGEVCSHQIGLYKADCLMQLEGRKSMECQSVYLQAMIINKFILISKEMIPCHSPPAEFMPCLFEIAIPYGSVILDSVTYHFQVEKEISSSMKVNFMNLANA